VPTGVGTRRRTFNSFDGAAQNAKTYDGSDTPIPYIVLRIKGYSKGFAAGPVEAEKAAVTPF
jgi:hypothetical protein